MKIVRSIKDITGDCWCRLTEENFNAIEKLGIKTYHKDIKAYLENPKFEETDIFYLYYHYNGMLYADWRDESLKCDDAPEIKFELEENIKPDLDTKADFNDLVSQREELKILISILENKLKEINIELIEKLKSEIN